MAGTFNYTRAYATVARQIARFGDTGQLRRGTNMRACKAAILQWTPRQQGLKLEGSVQVLISPLDPLTGARLAIPPDHEQDEIIFAGKVYRLASSDEGPRPNGVAMYHEYQGMYSSPA